VLRFVAFVRDPIAWQRLFVAAMLLTGGAPFAGCIDPVLHSMFGHDYDPAVDHRDLRLPDPSVVGGATVSLRGPAMLPGKSSAFVRTGVFVPFDGRKSDSFQALLGIASGTGERRENFAVPVVGGISVPVSSLGIPIANLSAELFGGVQITQRKMGFALTETGFAAGTSASSTYTDFDPAIGAGLQYYLGNFAGMPTSIGTNVTFDWVPSHSVSAPSSNFPSVVYTLNNSSHVNATAAIGLNFDIPVK
jgi:hypothetical protein